MSSDTSNARTSTSGGIKEVQITPSDIILVPARWGYIMENNEPLRCGRVVNEGYIYILDGLGKWRNYVVTEGRYFEEYTATVAPDLPVQNGNKKNFISIKNSNDAIKKLWVTYSPVKWTKAVREQHESERSDQRQKNMIEVSVTDNDSNSSESLSKSQPAGNYNFWERIDPSDGDNTQYYAIEYLKKYINPFTDAVYQPDKTNELKSFEESLEALELKGTTAKNTRRILSVTFRDPVGKLIDLNEFMIQAQLDYKPSEDNIYRFTVASLINTLKQNIDEKTKYDVQRHIDRVDKVTELSKPMPRWEGDGPTEAELRDQASAREEGALKYKERQVEAAWSNYSKLIRENEMNEWVGNFEAYSKSRKFELNNILDNLAYEYKSFFESEYLKNTMIHNFDKEDDTSRVYYTLTVQQFLGSTATIPMLSDLYDTHLSKKTAIDDNNYLARALVFNQDEVGNFIDSLPPTTSGLTLSEIMTASWSGLLYAGSAAIFGKYDAIAKQVGATVSLAVQLAVPFMKNYRTSQTLNGLMLSQKEYLFGYHHEKALTIVKGKGSYADARKALINGIMHITENGKLPTRIRESVDQALKTSGEMVRLNKSFAQSFIYYIDKNELRAGMSVYENSNKAYANKGALRQIIDRSVFTTPELFDQSYKDYKRFEDITNRKIDQAVRTNYFGAMLQTVACIFLISAFFQAKSQEERLAEGTKAVAGLMILLGGGLELRGNASKLMASELELMKNAGKSIDTKKLSEATRTASRLSIVARGLSIGGAAIFAGFDVNSALKARANDDKLLGAAYIGSAATGVGSTAFLMMSGAAATGIGVVLLIGFIGINLFIGYWKKTGMENWLNLGIWGVEDDGWSFEHTLEQFDLAVVGEDIYQKDN